MPLNSRQTSRAPGIPSLPPLAVKVVSPATQLCRARHNDVNAELKNWLFIGHLNAGRRSAIINLIVVSCQRHGAIRPGITLRSTGARRWSGSPSSAFGIVVYHRTNLYHDRLLGALAPTSRSASDKPRNPPQPPLERLTRHPAFRNRRVKKQRYRSAQIRWRSWQLTGGAPCARHGGGWLSGMLIVVAAPKNLEAAGAGAINEGSRPPRRRKRPSLAQPGETLIQPGDNFLGNRGRKALGQSR